MKILKRLIPVMLAAIMILALASCDFNVPKNDPEKNKEHIVDSINSGEIMGEFMASEGEIMPSVSVEDLKDTKSIVDLIKNFALEGTVKIQADGEVESGYFGIKDGVIALTAENEEMYYFIEDDFKIVSVVNSYDGYRGSVSTALADMIESLVGADAEDEEETESAEEEKNPLEDIELPEITAEDVTYDAENDRYILSEEYISEVIDVLLDEVVDIMYEDSSLIEKNAYKAAIMAYVKEMNIVFYFRAELEKMIGFGMTLSISDDLKKELKAENLDLEFYFGKDAINGKLNFKNDESEMSLDSSVVMDEKGKPEKINLNMSSKSSDYWEPNYLGTDNLYSVCGNQTVTISLTADLTKLGKDGELVSFKYNNTVDGIEIYAEDYWPGDLYAEEYLDREMTERYAGKTIVDNIDLKVVGSKGGRDFTLNLVQENNDQIDGEADRNTVEVVVSLDVKNFPQITDAVESARQEALDEYEDEFDFDFDFGFDY